MSTNAADEGFLTRWSRLKRAPEEAAPEPPAPPAVSPAAAAEPPPLPRVEDLTLESDFRGFFHPKVDESVRRAALRKLFSDPHFNVMDGLDTYIDDYTISEPIPPEMMAGLKQAQKILRWAEGKDDEKEGEETVPESAAASAEAQQPPETIAIEEDGCGEPAAVAAAPDAVGENVPIHKEQA